MSASVLRIRRGAVALGGIGLLGVLIYRWAGYPWIESLWMVVITISSVGFSEHSELSPTMQLATVFLIITGVLAAGYTFGGFLEMLTEGEIERALNRRRMAKGIEQLSNHVIICGYGRMGELVATNLAKRGAAFVVVESDDERLEWARQANSFFVGGDATEEDVLETAGIHRASTVVTTLPQDAANVFITLTVAQSEPASADPGKGQPSFQRTQTAASRRQQGCLADIGQRRESGAHDHAPLGRRLDGVDHR